ncbi:MAG: AMP-binding protein, partial [Planctomycetes bacterium]|nr:AMP-binding protein [Planctomycetota bacterium]
MKVPLTVSDFLNRAADAYGNRIGIVDEPQQPARPLSSLTFGEVKRLAVAQAAGLDRLGIGFGQRVAIVSKNAARLLISFFGVSGFGRVLVPINFRLQPEEISYIVQHSGASLLLVDAELNEALSKVTCNRRIVLDGDSDAEIYCEDVQPRPWQADEDATATINYTSGTTARPKGVQLTHRNLWINATVFGLHSRVSDRDVYLHTLPMFHCNGWGMPYVLSAMGAPQIVLRQVDGREILRRIEQHQVTLL